MSPAPICVITREQRPNDITVLHVAGVLDEHGRAVFKAHLNDLLEAGARRLILDCTATTYISSAGLGYMVSMRKRVSMHAGQLVVAGLNADLVHLFRVAKLADLFHLSPDLGTAEATFVQATAQVA